MLIKHNSHKTNRQSDSPTFYLTKIKKSWIIVCKYGYGSSMMNGVPKQVMAFIAATFCLTGCVNSSDTDLAPFPQEPISAYTHTQDNDTTVSTDQDLYDEDTISEVSRRTMLSDNDDADLEDNPKRIEYFGANKEDKNSFFNNLSKSTGENYIVNQGIPNSISISMYDVTGSELRKALEQTYDIQFTKEGRSWIVEPKRPVTQWYRVDHVSIKRSGSSSMDVSSESASSNTKKSESSSTASLNTEYDNSAFWISLKATVEQIVHIDDEDATDEITPVATEKRQKKRQDIHKINDRKKSVSVDENLGLIVVTAYKDEQIRVKQYLDSIKDVSSQQVIIEARILQVTLDEKSSKGLNLNFSSNKMGTGSVNLSDPDQPILKYQSKRTGDGDETGFVAAIHYLEKQGHVEVISSPKISAMNNQLAVIKVGEERYFATQNSSTQNNGGSNTTSNTVNKEALFSGIAFYLVPSIIHDEDQQRDIVTIHLRPSISHISTERTLLSGGTSNADSSSTSSEQYVDLPKISTTQVDTIVRLLDNEIAVIGGLTSVVDESEKSGLPGRMKSGGSAHRSKIETVILLRAHIVRDEDNMRRYNPNEKWNKANDKLMRG